MNSEKRKIIVGVDGSDHSIHALREAWRYSELLGAPIEVVTAWQYPPAYGADMIGVLHPDEDAKAVLNKALAEVFPEGTPDGLETTLSPGHPAHVILKAGKDAELIVVGCRGRGGFAGLLLGSVSSAVATHAHGSVLVTHLENHGGSVDSSEQHL